MRCPPARVELVEAAVLTVMAGLVPAIHVFLAGETAKTWMLGTGPGMTNERQCVSIVMAGLVSAGMTIPFKSIVR